MYTDKTGPAVPAPRSPDAALLPAIMIARINRELRRADIPEGYRQTLQDAKAALERLKVFW